MKIKYTINREISMPSPTNHGVLNSRSKRK